MQPNQIPDTDTPCWKATISPGDVVRFRFPVADCGDPNAATGPKLRPCLVLEVFHFSCQRFVRLAYGTSAFTEANKGCEVLVKHSGSCATAGLNRPTRFVGARSIIVSLDHPNLTARLDRLSWADWTAPC